MKVIQIKVQGSVHGVGFRWSTRKLAQKIGLVGFVKNIPDKTVLINVVGEKENVQKLINWCRKGTTFSRVDSVEVKEVEKDFNYNDFLIEH
jgi:acylphosphatase